MARQTASERLTQWKERVARATRHREDWETRYRVRDLERAFLGQDTLSNDTGDHLWVNHFFATVLTQEPALLPKQLQFAVTPRSSRKPFGSLEARLMTGVLQAIAEQDGNMYNDASLALSQAFFRIGVLKVVYDPRFEPNPQRNQPILMPNGMATGIQEPNEVLTDELYRWQWVDACKMLLPDEGANHLQWSWIAEEVEVPLEVAQDDERFPQGMRSRLQSNCSREMGSARTTMTMPSEWESEPLFRYYECWDIRRKRLVLWADGQQYGDRALLDEPFPDGIDNHPYSLLRFLPIVSGKPCAWPLPVTYNWLPLQQDYNILREQQSNAARRAARKFLYEATTFSDEEEMDKFTSSADMQGVAVQDLGRPPLMFGEASLNMDVSRAIAMAGTDWRIVTGASGTRLGDPDNATATEAVLVEQASALRDTKMRTQVNEWLGAAAKKMLQLVQQTLTLDIYISLRGMGDREFHEMIERPDIKMLLLAELGMEGSMALGDLLAMHPQMLEALRERFGSLRPIQVTRSELQFEADVEVVPGNARPIQQAQLLRLAGMLGPQVVMGSPTFVEELLQSFDIPQGKRITEELMLSVKKMQAMQMAMAQQKAQPAPTSGQKAGPSGPAPLREAVQGQSPLSKVGGML